jgi:hypothetical protein
VTLLPKRHGLTHYAWADDIGDISKAELVNDGSGKVLRTVMDSKVYCQENRKKTSKGSRQDPQKSSSPAPNPHSEGSPPPHQVSRSKRPRPKPPHNPYSDGDENPSSDVIESRPKPRPRRPRPEPPHNPYSDGEGNAESTLEQTLESPHNPYSDRGQSPTSNTIESRPKAPLPARARSQSRGTKRRRTSQSDDDDDTNVQHPSRSSHGRPLRGNLATSSSHSFAHPDVQASTAPHPVRREQITSVNTSRSFAPNVSRSTVPNSLRTSVRHNPAVPLARNDFPHRSLPLNCNHNRPSAVSHTPRPETSLVPPYLAGPGVRGLSGPSVTPRSGPTPPVHSANRQGFPRASTSRLSGSVHRQSPSLDTYPATHTHMHTHRNQGLPVVPEEDTYNGQHHGLQPTITQRTQQHRLALPNHRDPRMVSHVSQHNNMMSRGSHFHQDVALPADDNFSDGYDHFATEPSYQSCDEEIVYDGFDEVDIPNTDSYGTEY